MLNKRTAEFAEMIWEASNRLGNAPAKITDDVIERAFPKTYEEAGYEGARKMFRDGVMREVKRILTKTQPNEHNMDFSQIDETFAPLVKKLGRRQYHVPSLDQLVDIKGLIAEPDLLDEARHFMRQKGEECLAEALKLDKLYAAVTQ